MDTGGDLAFVNGVFKALLEEPGGFDAEYVRTRISSFEEAAEEVRRQGWGLHLERRPGDPR